MQHDNCPLCDCTDVVVICWPVGRCLACGCRHELPLSVEPHQRPMDTDTDPITEADITRAASWSSSIGPRSNCGRRGSGFILPSFGADAPTTWEARSGWVVFCCRGHRHGREH